MRFHHTLVHWFPRVLAVVFILFLSMFALDSFQGEQSFWMKLGAFLIHLIPSVLVLVTAIVAWKHERTGGILFIGLSVLFVLISRAEVTTLLLIPGPLILIGILFILDSLLERKVDH